MILHSKSSSNPMEEASFPTDLKNAPQVLSYSSKHLGRQPQKERGKGMMVRSTLGQDALSTQATWSTEPETARYIHIQYSHQAKTRPIHNSSLCSLGVDKDKCETIRNIPGTPSLKENTDQQKDGTLSKSSIENTTWKYTSQVLCPTMYLHVTVYRVEI